MTANPLEQILAYLVIAYSAGYEGGHADTVDGVFYGDGKTSTHDGEAAAWVAEAITDGTFDRDLSE